MDKNKFAQTPPMGWNSYDYYDTSVNEEQVKANADYMAAHLKQYGWDCSPVLSVFPRQRAERASGLWRITYTAWG